MLQNRIGFMASLGLSRMPADRVVRELSALGYGAVEWTLEHFNPRTTSPAERKRVVEVTEAAGMVASDLVVQQDYICLDDSAREDRIALSLECIEACAEAGIGTVDLFTGPAPWNPAAPRIPADISEGTAWDMLCSAIGTVVEALERHRVHGAVESVWGHLCNDYYTCRPLLDRFPSDFLGVTFDPSHDVLKGNFDTGWIVRQYGDRIKHVHLKDAAGIQQSGLLLFPFLGEGRVDWKGMFDALDQIGYAGCLSVEFESFAYHENVLKGDTVEAARRSIADVKALLAL